MSLGCRTLSHELHFWLDALLMVTRQMFPCAIGVAAACLVILAKAVPDSSIPFVQAPAKVRFAAAIAEYGLVLRHSRLPSAASLNHVRSVVRECLGVDRGGHRAEFVELIETAARISQAGSY